jgi:hypothetical protein
MSWLTTTFSSSLGKKLIMALTGLFLCTFLVVHLIGNLQLLKADGGASFNLYAKFMTSNPLIKTTSYLLYLSSGDCRWCLRTKKQGQLVTMLLTIPALGIRVTWASWEPLF